MFIISNSITSYIQLNIPVLDSTYFQVRHYSQHELENCEVKPLTKDV